MFGTSVGIVPSHVLGVGEVVTYIYIQHIYMLQHVTWDGTMFTRECTDFEVDEKSLIRVHTDRFYLIYIHTVTDRTVVET